MSFIKPTRVCVVLALLASVGGCANNVSTCQKVFELRCSMAFNCCEEDEREQFLGLFLGGYVNSEGECNDRIKDVCKGFLAEADDSVANGRAEFDAEKAQKCVDEAAAARDKCDPNAKAEDCDGFTTGLQKDGDKCANDLECDNGECQVDFDAEDGTPKDVDTDLSSVEGECKELPGKGDPCLGAFTCGDGLVCDFGSTTCVELKKNGDACADNFECDSEFCDPDSGECDDQPRTKIKICDGI